MVSWIKQISSEVRFLNVDLEVVSERHLQPLVDGFGDRVDVLYCGQWGDGTNLANFETHIEQEEEEELEEEEEPEAEQEKKEIERTKRKSDEGLADALILKFCALIEGLEGDAKELWETAKSRTFDLGYESGLAPYSLTSVIKAETLREIVKLGASINITVYRILEEDE